VLVLGATGRTGRELVAGALAQGHQVSAWYAIKAAFATPTLGYVS
jgi:putative NADH-flavin reductase